MRDQPAPAPAIAETVEQPLLVWVVPSPYRALTVQQTLDGDEAREIPPEVKATAPWAVAGGAPVAPNVQLSTLFETAPGAWAAHAYWYRYPSMKGIVRANDPAPTSGVVAALAGTALKALTVSATRVREHRLRGFKAALLVRGHWTPTDEASTVRGGFANLFPQDSAGVARW